MVGAARFELTTSCSQSRRSTRLSYAPCTGGKLLITRSRSRTSLTFLYNFFSSRFRGENPRIHKETSAFQKHSVEFNVAARRGIRSICRKFVPESVTFPPSFPEAFSKKEPCRNKSDRADGRRSTRRPSLSPHGSNAQSFQRLRRRRPSPASAPRAATVGSGTTAMSRSATGAVPKRVAAPVPRFTV